MKKILILVVACGFMAAAQAQTVNVEGRITNQKNVPLPGAQVVLTQPWGEVVTHALSGDDGAFVLSGVPAGGYKVRIAYIGYDPFEQEIIVKSETMKLGNLRLRENPNVLGEVQITEKLPVAVVIGDTTQFNAAAYKTLPDANAEDLVQKLPGVEIQNGTIKAQGEQVKEVLVDGKPFFGNDPMAALRNLPAEVIDKIQVFDQKSDQAQFTGFDDGNTSKTLNIITKSGMRSGQFGKVYAGYGENNTYNAGGNMSYLNGDQRISVIGQSNNVNIQNFSSEDLLGVTGGGGGGSRGGGRGGPGGGNRGGGPGGGGAGDFLVDQQGGIARTHAVGINYSDTWGKKLEVSGSYFFNKSDNEALQDLSRQYLGGQAADQIYTENNNSLTDNANHRFNAKLEFKLDSANSIVLRPRLSIQSNTGTETTFGQTLRNGQLLNQTDNFFLSDLQGLNFSNNLLYRHRFAKARRTVSLNLSTGYNDKTGTSSQTAENQYYTDVFLADTLDQRSDLLSSGWNWGANLSYTEPVGANSMLIFNVESNWKKDESDKKTFDFSEASQRYDRLNEDLSNVFSNTYTTQGGGLGYNYRKGDFTLMARAAYQHSQLNSDETFPMINRVSQGFDAVLPSAMLRYNVSRQENLNINYRTSTNAPSVTQLQNVIDNSNPLQLTLGNPGLQQAYQQRVFVRYQKTNTEKATVLFANIGGGITNRYIGNSTYLPGYDSPVFAGLDLAPGAQVTRPVNLDGQWNLQSFFTYGMPLTKLKSNLNFNLSGDYARSPGLINDRLNYSGQTTLGLGVVLGSNVSETLDFTLSSRSSFSQVDNTLQSGADTRYFSQNSSVRLGWVFGGGFVFRTTLNHQLYNGLSEDFNTNYWLWNLSIGRKLFKNQRGEISLSLFDALNQNRGISRTVTDIYLEDNATNVLQRYAMLNFTYNFRNFNSGKQAAPRERRDGRPFEGGRF